MDVKILSLSSILFVLWVFYSKMNQEKVQIKTFEQQFRNTIQIENKKNNSTFVPNKNLVVTNKIPVNIKTNELSKFTNQMLLQSKLSKKEFENIAFIRFKDDFKEFEYSYLGEIDDNMVMLAGLDSKNNTRIKIVAAPMNPSVNQVVAYIKENQSSLFKELSTKSLDNLKPYQSYQNINNFKNVQMLSTTDENGNLALVAIAYRKDGKGSYMTVLSGPKSYLLDNEGKYDQFFSSFQAKDYFNKNQQLQQRK
jgi:hypothetical protein